MAKTCLGRFLTDIFCTQSIEIDAGEIAAEDFLDHFDNPKPIIQEIGKTLEGFGERTIIFIFILIFLIVTIILWTLVVYNEISWIAALILNIIILVTIIIFVIIYRILIKDYLDIQYEIILNSLEVWASNQTKNIGPAANSAACTYSDNCTLCKGPCSSLTNFEDLLELS